MPLLASILLAAATLPLVEPYLKLGDYHYTKIGTNLVAKYGVPIDAMSIPSGWNYAPRFSNYNGMTAVGFNASFVPCIRGANFKTPVVKTEDMLWLSEAWNERVDVTRGNFLLSDLKFGTTPIKARNALNNPFASGLTPWIITADIRTDGAMEVYGIDDAPVFRPEFLIELFGGNFDDPQPAHFANPTIAQGEVLTVNSFANFIAYLNAYKDRGTVITPNVGGLVESGQRRYNSNKVGYWQSQWVTYNHPHNPELHASSVDPETETIDYYTNGPIWQWENDTEKSRLYYLNSWIQTGDKFYDGYYSVLSGGEVYTTIKQTETDQITSQLLYLEPNVFSNVVARGGNNRLDMTSVSGVHLFYCTYEDSYNTREHDRYSEPVETEETKIVLLSEAASSSGVELNSITGLFHVVSFNTRSGDYEFQSTVDLANIIPEIWKAAFPSHQFCTENSLADPITMDYSETDSDARTYGQSYSRSSRRWTRHTVRYDGVWAGCCRFNFRTKGKTN